MFNPWYVACGTSCRTGIGGGALAFAHYCVAEHPLDLSSREFTANASIPAVDGGLDTSEAYLPSENEAQAEEEHDLWSAAGS